MSGENRLGDNTTEGHHSKTSVLDFLQFHVINLSLSLSLEETNTETEVTGLASRSLKHLTDGNPGKHLSQTNEEKDLSHGTELNCGIVSSRRSSSSVGLRVRVDVEAIVYGNKSKPGKHTDAAVLELRLTKVVHGEVVTDAKRVESGASNKSNGIRRDGKERNRLRLLSGEAGGCLSCKQLCNRQRIEQEKNN